MNREVLLPATRISVPFRRELAHLTDALKEKDRGLLKIDLDGSKVRDDGFSVSQDAPLYGAGAERLMNAVYMQRQLRVIRYVGLVAFQIQRHVGY